MILECGKDRERLLSGNDGVISQEICSNNYFKEGKRVVGLRKRPTWHCEGWKKPGEVSLRDYERIGLERQGGGNFMTFFWQMKELRCMEAVTLPKFQKSKTDYLWVGFDVMITGSSTSTNRREC